MPTLVEGGEARPGPGGGGPGAPDNGRRRGIDRPFKIVTLVVGLALVGFVAFVVTTSLGSRATPASTFPQTAPTSLPRGTLAPAFSLPRLGGGTPVTLAATRGRPAIVNFFASWCSHCRAELRAVATVATAAGGKVSVVGVDTSDADQARVRQLLANAGATYPVGVDPKGHVATEYRLTGLPVTYFLDARGRVAGVAFGAQTTASLDRWVHRLTSGGSS